MQIDEHFAVEARLASAVGFVRMQMQIDALHALVSFHCPQLRRERGPQARDAAKADRFLRRDAFRRIPARANAFGRAACGS
jgi:hypothetical protein